jgi:hypothetical protein
MGDPVGALHSSLCELAARLERLEARVGQLESRAAGAADSARLRTPEDEAQPVPRLPQGTLALLGRTLLVLAGAYVVRALTDGQALPAALGVGLGIGYAALWQLRADRDALAGRVQSAAFHDIASSLIAFPLVWEATARFGLLGAPAGAAVLVGFFALGLAVAWHRRLAANAVVTTLLALGTAVALLAATHDLLAGLLALIAIAAGLEWLAIRGAWLGLRWVGAAVLDGTALLVVAILTRPTLPQPYAGIPAAAAALVLLAIPALYIASVAARTLRLGQAVTTFEVVQGTAAVLLGFGGAVRVLAARGLPETAPGALALLLGLLCYGAAFVYVERRSATAASAAGFVPAERAGGAAQRPPEPGSRNFYFYSTAGGLLTLGGTTLLGLGPALPLAWCAAGLVSAVLGRRFGRMTLRVHGALFLGAAAVQTGLLTSCALSLGGRGASVTAAGWTAAAAALAAWIVLATDAAAPRSGGGRLPQLLLALVVVLAAGKAVHAGLCGALGGWLSADAGASAVARTGVLATLVLALAFVSGRGTLPELGWLVYPLVALGGLKLLMQDLREGRPATLVLSLTLYGLVLTLAPRLMKARATGS